ncbi:MAG: DUF5320 domain-containing protein [Anaerolineae bacterium]
MPGFDGTGPEGAGPMTGGARGQCNPTSGATSRFRPLQRFFGRGAPRSMSGRRPRWGLRLGGRGRGRGRRR